MITREPRPGDRIEYLKRGRWVPAGEVVSVLNSMCFTLDPGQDVKPGTDGWPPGVNNGFIWRFHDGLNQLHRIRE